jgi:hypothetical protein
MTVGRQVVLLKLEEDDDEDYDWTTTNCRCAGVMPVGHMATTSSTWSDGWLLVMVAS